MKKIIPRLDIMVVYACNIACKGCISISDWPRKGYLSLDDLTKSIEYWSTHLSPKVITVFGGEPLMHPKILECINLIRNSWPDSNIRLITNGYLLNKFDPAEWFNFRNFEIQVSVHRKDHEEVLNKKIQKILDYKPKWHIETKLPVKHIKVKFTVDSFSIYKSHFKDFNQPYVIKDQKPNPCSSDPSKAHKICGSPNTPILYKGKLYKCPPIANLQDLYPSTYNFYNATETADTLDQFISNIGKPESCCSMCPQDETDAIDHFNKDNVYVKHNIS